MSAYYSPRKYSPKTPPPEADLDAEIEAKVDEMLAQKARKAQGSRVARLKKKANPSAEELQEIADWDASVLEGKLARLQASEARILAQAERSTYIKTRKGISSPKRSGKLSLY